MLKLDVTVNADEYPAQSFRVWEEMMIDMVEASERALVLYVDEYDGVNHFRIGPDDGTVPANRAIYYCPVNGYGWYTDWPNHKEPTDW